MGFSGVLAILRRFEKAISYQEDQSRLRHPGAAQILATLRNLSLSLYELNVARREPEDGAELGEAVRGFPDWRRRLKAGEAITLLRR